MKTFEKLPAIRLNTTILLSSILFAVIITFLTFSISQSSTSGFNFNQDKILHTVVSGSISSSLTKLMIDSKFGYDPVDVIVAPQLAVALIGGLKEFADATILDGNPSGYDLLYNQIGGIFGSLVTWSINDFLNNKRISQHKKNLKL